MTAMGPTKEANEREQAITMICALEAGYWAEVEDEKLREFSMGAMGAASNICAAVLRGISPEQFRKEIEQRSK